MTQVKNQDSGIGEFLKTRRNNIKLPTTINEWIAILKSPESELAEEVIIANLTDMPVELLIKFYEAALNRDSSKDNQLVKQDKTCQAIVEVFLLLEDEVKDLSVAQISILVRNIKGLTAKLAGRESNQRWSLAEIFRDVESYPLKSLITYLNNNFRQNETSVVVAFFRKTVEEVVSSISEWGHLRYILKQKLFSEEYLPIVYKRAEEILEKLSIDELRVKKSRYEAYPNCVVGCFLPFIKELLAERYHQKALAVKTAKEFLSLEIIPKDVKVRTHFCKLVAQLNLETLEDIFQCTTSPNDSEWKDWIIEIENIPNWSITVLMNQYSDLIGCPQNRSEKHLGDLKWFWQKVFRCPFEDFWEVFDKPLRDALSQTPALKAWKLCHSDYNRQMHSYTITLQHKYVCWLNRRIPKEENIEQLNYWLGLGKRGSRTEHNILKRAREIWEPLSFEKLAKVGMKDFSRRLSNFKEELLFEKLPAYLATERSLEELHWAYNQPWLYEVRKINWNICAKKVLEKLAYAELLAWDKKHQKEHFRESIYESLIDRFDQFAMQDVEDKSLHPTELQKRANEIPGRYGHVRGILSGETKRRVLQNEDINEVAKMLHSECSMMHTARERFWQLLPDALRTKTEKEITGLFNACPKEMRKEFISIALRIEAGTWVDVVEEDEGIVLNRAEKGNNTDVPF